MILYSVYIFFAIEVVKRRAKEREREKKEQKISEKKRIFSDFKDFHLTRLVEFLLSILDLYKIHHQEKRERERESMWTKEKNKMK